MKKKHILIIGILMVFGIFTATACGIKPNQNNNEAPHLEDESNSSKDDTTEEAQKDSYCISEGTTLQTRIKVPENYDRIEASEGSFTSFLRNYPMKEDGSPVLLYDGQEKGNQSAHAAVFELPIEKEDLQQCADSVMRMYAEYFWATRQYDKIKFHFSDGFEAKYSKWREGYRISFDGDDARWVKRADYDDSYECFVKYMRIIFAYAGTYSMESETKSTTLAELKTGDVFLKGGSPGHVVMVVDVCENQEGKKAFLLAQGYMPAQEFHVVKNPMHEEDPWYYEEEITYPLRTPQYTFAEGSLRKLEYMQ